MIIYGYDAQDNYTRKGIKLGEFWQSEISSVTSGSVTYSGETYNIVATHTSSYDEISITGRPTITDPDTYSGILHAVGLTIKNVFDYPTTVQGCFPSSDGSLKLSTYNAGLSTYYYDFSRTTSGSTIGYSLSIGNVSATANYNSRVMYIYVASMVSHTTENNVNFGLLRIRSETGSTYNTTIILKFSRNVTNQTYLQVSASPGEKGFTPIGLPDDEDTSGGGDESSFKPTYNTDVITQPGAPDETKASVVGSGMLTVYDVTSANLAELGKCLFSSNVISAISNMIISPLDFIVSLNIFPYTPHIGSSTPIKFGWFKCTQASAGFDANGAPLTSQFRVVDFGTLNVNEMWKSFLDYDATSFELFLPFIGTVSLSINEVMGGSINVQYTIDYYTGMCVANVLCIRNVKTSSKETSVTQYSQHSYQGNCAIQVPVSQIGYNNMIGSLINAGINGIKSGTGVGAVASMTNDLVSGALKPDVTSKGAIVANAGFCSVLYPYITITRPLTAEPQSFQEVMGYPCYNSTTLGSCEGLCICDGIDLSGVTGATDSEMNRIKQMCMEGVYV